jgi:hypothetical protein
MGANKEPGWKKILTTWNIILLVQIKFKEKKAREKMSSLSKNAVLVEREIEIEHEGIKRR